jgi:hypothetical protein
MNMHATYKKYNFCRVAKVVAVDERFWSCGADLNFKSRT